MTSTDGNEGTPREGMNGALPGRRTGQPEERWAEPYLLAVGAQLDWWFSSDWHTLQGVDPGLERRALGDLLRELDAPPLDAAAVPAAFERHGDSEPAERPAVARLRQEVARVRAAGERAFADPWLPLFELACTSDWPLRLAGLPQVDHQDAGKVVLVEFDDFPHHDPVWRERGRLVGFPAVEALSLQGDGLTDRLGIDLPSLANLRILDLERNELVRLPNEVASCRGLEALLLSGNPQLGPSLDATELDRKSVV